MFYHFIDTTCYYVAHLMHTYSSVVFFFNMMPDGVVEYWDTDL